MHSVNRWNNKRSIVPLLLAVIVMLLSGCSADTAAGSNVSGDTTGSIGLSICPVLGIDMSVVTQADKLNTSFCTFSTCSNQVQSC